MAALVAAATPKPPTQSTSGIPSTSIAMASFMRRPPAAGPPERFSVGWMDIPRPSSEKRRFSSSWLTPRSSAVAQQVLSSGLMAWR
jgi:hypothetical protein